VPFVAGEELSPLVRVAATSDFGNALGYIRFSEGMGLINADITLYLHRQPVGEWLCLEANTMAQESGLGVVETVVSDEQGAVGRICQAVLSSPRSTDR
jgi:hypothetical protein